MFRSLAKSARQSPWATLSSPDTINNRHNFLKFEIITIQRRNSQIKLIKAEPLTETPEANTS